MIARNRQATALADYSYPPGIDAATQRSQRREPRALLAVPLVISGLRRDGHIFHDLSASRDASRSGCRFHLSIRPEVGSPLAVRVIHPQPRSRESERILFEVIWLRPEGNGWAVGARCLGDCDFRALAMTGYQPL